MLKSRVIQQEQPKEEVPVQIVETPEVVEIPDEPKEEKTVSALERMGNVVENPISALEQMGNVIEPTSTVTEEKEQPVEEKTAPAYMGDNQNQVILDMYNEGKTIMDIAKLLGKGQGEVKLVIDLFQGAKK